MKPGIDRERLRQGRASMLAKVNRERSRHRLPPVATHDALQSAAQRHSEDMARRQVLSHRGADGSEAGRRVRQEGYAFLFVAENVAAGTIGATRAVALWMQSAGHRRNILLPQARHAGIGLASTAPAGRTAYYWTLVLAAPLRPVR